MKNLFRKMIVALSFVAVLGMGSITAQAAEVSLDVPVVTKYVWRGLATTEEPVLQPSLTVPMPYGLSFNLWGNMDLTSGSSRTGEFTEIDLTGDYSTSFGPIGLSFGIISYIFPGAGAGGTTHELYGSVSADVIASPSLTVYSDVDEVKGSYFLLGLGQSFGLEAGPLTGIDLGASLGYGSGSYNRAYFGIDEAKPVDLVISLGLPMTFGKISVTPAATYSYLLDSDISEALDETGYFYVSLGASLSL